MKDLRDKSQPVSHTQRGREGEREREGEGEGEGEGEEREICKGNKAIADGLSI